MKYLSIISVSILIALIFYKNKSPDIKQQVSSEVKVDMQVASKKLTPKVVKKANMAIPKKIKKDTHIRAKQVDPDVDQKIISIGNQSSGIIIRDGLVPMTKDGDIIITHAFEIDNKLISHGDIIVGDMEAYKRSQKTGKPLILPRPKLWEKGKIPYIVDSSLQLVQKERIEKAIKKINKLTNISFIKKEDSHKDYVHFENASQHCFSNLGRIGGKQSLSISINCTESEVLHEMMHTLGFIHEHNRVDRDEYIDVLTENIKEEFKFQFAKIDNKFINLTQNEFDFDSILLYPSYAFSKFKGDNTILKYNGDILHAKYELSRSDIKKINNAYPK